MSRLLIAIPPVFSPEYIAYRDRVVAAGGSIDNGSQTQAAMDTLAALGLGPHARQWLDARFGRLVWETGTQAVRRLFSLVGADATSANAAGTPTWQANAGGWEGPVLVNQLNQSLDGGTVAALDTNSNYTWGIHVAYQEGAIILGNRYGGENSWMKLQNGGVQWVNLNANGGGVQSINFSQPINREWLWLVKTGMTLSLYNASNVLLASRNDIGAMPSQPFGIGGDPTGTETSTMSWQTSVRFSAALTSSQRAAIQGI